MACSTIPASHGRSRRLPAQPETKARNASSSSPSRATSSGSGSSGQPVITADPTLVDMASSTVDITTPDGVADAYFASPDGAGDHPGVLLIMDAFGLRPRIEEMADRIAAQGYVVLAPNVFYRAGRTPLFDVPDLTDADARAAFFEQIRPLM